MEHEQNMTPEESEKLNRIVHGIYDTMTDAQKEKAKACTDMDELTSYMGDEGIELPDELLDEVGGGAATLPLFFSRLIALLFGSAHVQTAPADTAETTAVGTSGKNTTPITSNTGFRPSTSDARTGNLGFNPGTSDAVITSLGGIGGTKGNNGGGLTRI